MSTSYAIPAGSGHRTELVVRRSRFLTTTGHAADAAAARAFVEGIRREFPDATHNCWAFAAGPPGDTARVGFSDDGEPHGTAGRPMLAVLLHSGVGEVATVVTRYFGGVKLGTGGLVRAYQEAVGANLQTLPLGRRVERVRLEIIVDYPHVDGLRRLFPAFEVVSLHEEFTADALFRVSLPLQRYDAFCAALNERTDGAALLEKLPASDPS